MARQSISEVGHARNAANFNVMLDILGEMGSLYAPAASVIALEKLQSRKLSLGDSLQAIAEKFPEYRDVVAEREVHFNNLPKYGTRVKNAYFAVEPAPALRENVQGLVKRLRGDSRKKVVSETEASESISNSHRSYDSQAATWLSLASYVGHSPNYVPNEAPLTAEVLHEHHRELMELNNRVSMAAVAMITVRKNRNDILYNGDESILELVKMVKAYLRSLEEAREYYEAVVRLKFTPPRR